MYLKKNDINKMKSFFDCIQKMIYYTQSNEYEITSINISLSE